MQPRHFQATAILCLALMVSNVILAPLPHVHLAADGSHVCEHAACQHSASTKHTHSGCQHSHATCSHHSHCSHDCTQPEPARSESPAEAPCHDCTLCRHQAQAALPCTVIPELEFLTRCTLLPDHQSPQVAAVVALVYQGRGPPTVL